MLGRRFFVKSSVIAILQSSHKTVARSLLPTSTTRLSSSSSSSSSIEKDSSKKQQCIYLDYNGTTPIDKRVLAAMLPYLTDHFGNPSSSHYYGQAPKEAIAKARASILSLLYSDVRIQTSTEHQNSIIFTGCGTEADNLAIHLALEANRGRFVVNGDDDGDGRNEKYRDDETTQSSLPHIITSNVEHPAIEQYLKALEDDGQITVTYVPVNPEGIVPTQDMMNAIDEKQTDTVLVTLMLAQNESGALQSVKEIAEYCKARGILFHTDAAQGVGKVSISMDHATNNNGEIKGIGDGVDMVTIVGHKFGAPKGIACLYVKPNCFTKHPQMVNPQRYMLLGGGQEGGRRAGTENVPYIVGLGAAADNVMEKKEEHGPLQWQQNARWMNAMRSRMYENLLAGLGEDIVRDNGPTRNFDRLPNTLSVGLKGINSGEMLSRIQNDVACSAGSACHASGDKISAVLEAMKIPIEYARGTLRISVGADTTEEEIDLASDIIIEEAKRQLSTK